MESDAQGGSISVALSRLSGPDELGDYVRQGREEIFAAAEAGLPASAAGHALAELLDAVLRRMFDIARERAEAMPRTRRVRRPAELALIATGGFGRRELAPYSDIDLSFLPSRDGDERVDEMIRELFRGLMDVFLTRAKLKVGYAYRLIDDCGSLDHKTQTGLLDARLIAGSRAVFAAFRREFATFLNPADFLFQKIAERQAVRARAGDSPYAAEPDVKEGAGGLRDLQTAEWLARVRWGIVPGEVWSELVTLGLLSGDEGRAAREAHDFLFSVRFWLQRQAGEARDRLAAGRQEEVARRLGFAGAERLGGPGEALMADYYRHAAAADRVSRRVTRLVERSRLLLGIGLDVEDREIVPANDFLGRSDPAWAFTAVELAQCYGLGLSPAIEARVAEALAGGRLAPPDGPSDASETLLRIVRAPERVGPALRRLVDLGLLGWLIPEFDHILRLIPYDAVHAYSVGGHSLVVAEELEALRDRRAGDDPGRAELRRLFDETGRHDVLFLAALLHDVGKGRPEDHAEVGAPLSGAIARRLGLDEAGVELLEFLVRHHLVLSRTARQRDLTQAETIREVARLVGDPERLRLLTLLTDADVRAVGPGVWTSLQASFLLELYHRTESFLLAEADAEAAAPADEAALERMKRRLSRQIRLESLPPQAVEAHVARMPPSYLLSTPPGDIARHIELAARVDAGDWPAFEWRDRAREAASELIVCTRDLPEPGLLSRITGVLYATDINVYSAQVFTREPAPGDPDGAGLAIDTLLVDFRGGPLPPGKKAEAERELAAVLRGEQPLAALLQRKKKVPAGGAHAISHIELHDELSESFTLLDLRSDDEPGLLFRVTSALSSLGWSIHSARASTRGDRVRQSFYLTDAAGAKLPSGPATARRLRQALDRPPANP